MSRGAARSRAVEGALAVAPTPASGPQRAYVYSDLGFVVLGELLGRVLGRQLDALVAERVARPLGLAARFNRLSDRHAWVRSGDRARRPWSLSRRPGRTRPREPAPGQEGLWDPFAPHPSSAGEVDDDNAFVMDGVAGHAGPVRHGG